MAFQGPAEDRLAIRDLLDAYADAVTRNNVEDWAACWAEDSVWDLPDYPEIGETHGKAAITAMWVEAMKPYPGIMFQAWPGSIVIDGDRAEVRSWTAEVFVLDGVVNNHRGHYEDICVKRDGKWLFINRSFRNIHRS